MSLSKGEGPNLTSIEMPRCKGRLYCTAMMRWMVLRKLRGSCGSSKGYAPANITKSVTLPGSRERGAVRRARAARQLLLSHPQDHTSAALPSYSLRCSTSGAM